MSSTEFNGNFGRRQGLIGGQQLIIKLGPDSADISYSKDYQGVI